MLLRCLSLRSWLGVLLLVFLTSLLYYSTLPLQIRPDQSKHVLNLDPALVAKPSHLCRDFPTPKDLVVVVKTGANEVYHKLSTQLLTMLQCYGDVLIFSDLEQQIGKYAIHDALDNVTESVKVNNPDFDYYRTLQESNKHGQIMSTLREDHAKAAWTLDKYKFVHMLQKTWIRRPHQKWYVFIEADTYLVRSNLLLWLARFDPSEVLFLGSPTFANGKAFAHGGSGFVLSGAAMSRFAEGDPDVASRYDEDMKNEGFGDYLLTKALQDKDIELTYHWPVLQAEKPATIPFGPGPDNGRRHWCQPAVTFHHVMPEDVSRLWDFEQQRHDIKTPLLLQELYRSFVSPEIYTPKDDWYNLSDDVFYRPPWVDGDRQKTQEEMTELEKKAYMSFEDCGRACDKQQRCYQYVYSQDVCGFSYSFRLGHRRVPESGTSYKSGWNSANIARFQNMNPCDVPEWG